VSQSDVVQAGFVELQKKYPPIEPADPGEPKTTAKKKRKEK
jgi:hypothetical protein